MFISRSSIKSPPHPPANARIAGVRSASMPFVRAFLFVSAMIAAFVFLVPVQTIARRRGWPIQGAIQMGFCRVMCWILGIEVRSSGVIAKVGPRFVAANHVSWTDIIALSSLSPFVFLAKREVARWPVLGNLARLQGTLFVNRSARRDLQRTNASIMKVLREGRDLVVFAEGTSSDGADVLPFKSAHFDAVQSWEGDLRITPVAIAYSDGVRPIDAGWYGEMTFVPHLWAQMKRGGMKCNIIFGEAVDACGRDRKSLAMEAEAEVRRLLSIARAL